MTITLTGLVAPEQIGKLASLDELQDTGRRRRRHVLVDGAGRVYGAFIIEGMNEGQTLHMQDGTPRRIEFSLDLARVDDGLLRKRTEPKKDTGDASA